LRSTITTITTITTARTLPPDSNCCSKPIIEETLKVSLI
jgi:hypothetical protein